MEIYHRKQTRTQTPEVAHLQEISREIWGGSPWGSDTPTVQAYWGSLPPGERGVEFVTDIPPDRGSPPSYAYWRVGRSEILSVEKNGRDYAVLRVIQVINCQR
jgi:hypothetical protein